MTYEELRPPEFWQVDHSAKEYRGTRHYSTPAGPERRLSAAAEKVLSSVKPCSNASMARPQNHRTRPVGRSRCPLLRRKLQDRINALNALHGSNQQVRINGVGQSMVLHFLDNAPDVDIEFSVDPLEAADHVSMILINDEEERVVRRHPEADPGSHP